jgi:hypothetical protein
VNSICCSSFVSFSVALGYSKRTIAKIKWNISLFFSLDFDALSDGS